MLFRQFQTSLCERLQKKTAMLLDDTTNVTDTSWICENNHGSSFDSVHSDKIHIRKFSSCPIFYTFICIVVPLFYMWQIFHVLYDCNISHHDSHTFICQCAFSRLCHIHSMTLTHWPLYSDAMTAVIAQNKNKNKNNEIFAIYKSPNSK